MNNILNGNRTINLPIALTHKLIIRDLLPKKGMSPRVLLPIIDGNEKRGRKMVSIKVEWGAITQAGAILEQAGDPVILT